MRRLGWTSLMVWALATPAGAHSLAGHWVGTESAAGVSLPVTFDFADDRSGRFSCATQRALDYPFDLTIQPESGQSFFFGHAAPGYDDLMIAWVGSVARRQ